MNGRECIFTAAALLLTLVVHGQPGAEAMRTLCAPVSGPKRVLVHTVSAGYEHEVAKRPAPDEMCLVEKVLVEMGRSSGVFEAVPAREAAAFEKESLTKLDAVLFYTTGDLPLSDAQREALFAWVRAGGAFVGVHCATDTYPSVPEYGEMVGARFDGHPWHQKVRVRVEEPSHFVTRHLAPSFEIEDEIYQMGAPYDRARLRVLLALDVASVDLDAPGVHRTDRDFALAWTKPYGRGRVFYTALGHRPEVWRDPRFTKLLENGLRWAMKLEPRPDLAPEDRAQRDFAESNAGDPAKGYALFRRESGPVCARCHKVDGAGGDVGPDLSGIARRLTREEILDAVLAPSASIDPKWAAETIELVDGTLLFGRVVGKNAESILLAETDGLTRVTPLADIARRVPSTTSVMPDGLARTLSAQEFADLYAYVTTLTMPAAPAPAAK